MSCSTDRSAVWDSCWRDRQGDECSSMVGTFGKSRGGCTRRLWPLVAPLSASTMPAASPRRHVGHSAVMIAVGLLDNWIATKMKIGVPRVATRPAAGFRGERDDLLGSGET